MNDITGNTNGVSYSVDKDTFDDLSSTGINVVEEINQATAATLYTKDNCPYCVRAKALLSQKGFTINEINAVENKESLIQKVTEATGNPPMTVPQIWLGGQYIGGYTELAKHFAKSA